jgi:hypothetical protein
MSVLIYELLTPVPLITEENKSHEIYQKDREPPRPLIKFGFIDILFPLELTSGSGIKKFYSHLSELKYDPYLVDHGLQSLNLRESGDILKKLKITLKGGAGGKAASEKATSEKGTLSHESNETINNLSVLLSLYEIIKIASLSISEIDAPLNSESFVKLLDGAIPMEKKASSLLFLSTDYNIDEVNQLSIYMNQSDKIKGLSKGSHMIIRFNSMFNQTTIKYIYYLALNFTFKFLVKPLSSSSLSGERYLILIGLNEEFKNLPTYPLDSFLIDLFPSASFNGNFVKQIQKFNGEVYAKLLENYLEIKKYVDDENYYGPVLDEFQLRSKKLLQSWEDIYLKPHDDKFYNAMIKFQE